MAKKVYELMECFGGLYTRTGVDTGLFTVRSLVGLLKYVGNEGKFALVRREELTGKGYFEFFIVEALSGVMLVDLCKVDIHTVAAVDNGHRSIESVIGRELVRAAKLVEGISVEYYAGLFKINQQFFTEEEEWWSHE